MPIEPGEKTDEPIRTRGWTHWHHLFGARQFFMFAAVHKLHVRSPQRHRSNFANELNLHVKALRD